MKKLMLLLTMSLLLVPTLAKADTSVIDLIAQVPALKQGIAYSLVDSNINYISTVDLVKWKGLSIEGGYAGSAKNTGDKLVGVISYDLLNLKDIAPTIPILNVVEFRPGIWFGVGRIGGSNETDWGISATVISLKF